MISNTNENMVESDKTRLQRACELLDPNEEQALAEVGVNTDVQEWPDSRELSESRIQLSRDECEDAWVNLCVFWDVDQNYWYPLRQDDPKREDIIAFYTPFFEKQVGDLGIRKILEKHNVISVKELREGGTGESVARDALEIYYSGLEGYWTSDGYEWLIYASHEHSTTIAGKWLVEEVKSIWPDWEKFLYHSPFEEDYL